jgi:hypothetical protein
MRTILFLLTILPSLVLAQTDPSIYETEDVSKYRHRIAFEEPQVTVAPQPVPTPAGESLLNQYFTDGRKLYIDADQKLGAFVAAHVEINQSTQTMEGYRIQIFAGSRDGANSARARLLRSYSDLEAYVVPIEPNYRVRVGNFTTRAEAQRVCNKIRSSFPSAWVIKDKIRL